MTGRIFVKALTAGCVAILAIVSVEDAARAVAPLDYPLTPGTRWSYRMHQELGEGVSFNPEDAKLAKGNTLETTVVSVVVGPEQIDGQRYVKVQSAKNGKEWLTEWYRQDEQGLFIARRVEEGEDTTLDPPQKLLGPQLKVGDKWSWKAADAPISAQMAVAGMETVKVPAGTFQAYKVSSETRIQAQVLILVRQDRWFAPGVGYVKWDTKSTIGPRTLSRVTLDLEKFEKPG